MKNDDSFDLSSWKPDSSAATGDARENSPDDAGFTADDERLFRSHFQRANRLADRSFEQVRGAYQLGHAAAASEQTKGRSFADVEQDLENGWLNIRTGSGDWASVREFAHAAFHRGLQGTISDPTPMGTTPTGDRPPYADPLNGNVDSTEPGGPNG